MYFLVSLADYLFVSQKPLFSWSSQEPVASLISLSSWVYHLHEERPFIERVTFYSCSAWLLGIISSQLAIVSLFCSLCISYFFFVPHAVAGKEKDQEIISCKKIIHQYEKKIKEIEEESFRLKEEQQDLRKVHQEEFLSLEKKIDQLGDFRYENLQKEFWVEDFEKAMALLKKENRDLEEENRKLSLKLASCFSETIDLFGLKGALDNAPSSGACERVVLHQEPLDYLKLYVDQLALLIREKSQEMTLEQISLIKAILSFSFVIIQNLEKKR